MVVEVDDLKLIELFKEGNKDVFAEIVKRYQNKVYNTTYRMMSNREDAYDLAQEVFIKVYHNLHRFQGKSSFSTWLFTVTGNLCRDALRKRKREINMESLEKNIVLNGGEVQRELADTSMTPEQMTLLSEFRDEIQELINKLPINQKEVIILREIEGFSYEEIAEIIGEKLGTVKSRISRGRRKLRNYLIKN